MRITMRSGLRRLLAVMLSATLTLALAACSGEIGSLNLGGGLPLTAIQQNQDDEGNVELLLEPVDVWDDQGALEAEQIEVSGKTLYFRMRNKDIFENAWVRVGLFWHTKLNRIYMPVVVSGPPVEITRIRVTADESSEILEKATNFNFEPGKRPFDKELSSGVFTMSPSILATVTDAENFYVDVITNRGQLRVNLSAVTDRTASTLTASAKYQFAEFYRRQQALK